ncbi:DeoR/GlpR family DNA-binding transcription regulator [Luteimicrobium subarcticum]|uniref:DeoR family transcriptional regulator n=1 Tax=Luteimicrobium subarcticum TaxID=620910 RepID=A0A2M8W710_9MICO|nr:DeoR/GlpR family DNA-binding transcription regulator [Luteimicrobium subarcticum]PJI86682.1 DeoR family transcriptional regulator [Luteimicrobium subarcticum]
MTTDPAVEPSARRDAILDEIARRGSVRVGELAGRLRVSPLTVRRDIGALAAAGRVRKVHGGAVQVEGSWPRARPSEAPGTDAPDERPGETVVTAAVARAVVDLLAPGDAVVLVGAGVTEQVAHALAERRAPRPLTVVPTSLRAALLLAGERDRGLVTLLPGGEQSPRGMLVGPVAEETLASLHVDLAVVELAGLGPDGRLTVGAFDEVAVCRTAQRAAARTVAVVPADRIDRPGLARWGGLADLDVLVTDAPPSSEVVARLAAADVRLVVAGEPDTD